MKTLSHSSKRGSALLIVLGLLSFLMISAVAFSISMRTERTAAAAYRRGLMARELLDNAFVDARATLEHALRDQQENFDVNNPATYTLENLAPFRYPDNDNQYGRVLVSYDPVESGEIAYLLDDTVMRHVPPYIAYSIYTYLEKGTSVVEGDGYSSGNAMYSYKLDTSAGWKPVTVDIPDLEQGDRIDGEDTSKATVGRMAWAVVNLSDSLDLNAVGSASVYRGIGLTGNEFAFGTVPGAQNAPSEIYDLIETADSPDGSEVQDMPTFCSNADIARYAATVSGASPLVVDNGNEFPYAWQDAVEKEGEGFFSPFSCYGFWPNALRKGENAADKRTNTSASSGTNGTTITCDQVKQQTIRDTGAMLASEIQEQAGGATYLGDDVAGQNFVRMLLDYIDDDAVPAHFDTGATEHLFANAQPTVENVPMLSEVGYDAANWTGEEVKNDFKEMVEEAVGDIDLGAFAQVTKLEDIAQNLKGTELEFALPKVDLLLALRTYFPGYAETTESYDIVPVGFVGAIGAGKVEGGSVIEAKTPYGTATLKVGGATLTADNGSDVFSGTGAQPSVTCTPGEEIKVTFKGDQIPVTYQTPTEIQYPSVQPPAKQDVAFSFLVDYLFRVDTLAGSEVVDRCPTDKGLGQEMEKEQYPKTEAERLTENKMARLDAQYFRVTCPVTMKFALQWKLAVDVNPQDNSDIEIKYEKVEIVDNQITVEVPFAGDFELGNVTLKSSGDAASPSYQTISPEKGTWFTVDPRYNWLSPMLGLTSASAGGYGTQQAIRKNLSSPHWLFVEDEQITSGSDASDVQKDYAAANEEYVPFSWGLEVKDLRYGHNDSGQLLLPGEVGFLPVPLSTATWHPNERAYNRNSLDDYYAKVAKASFFRTVPMVDLKDGALSEQKYQDYANLCKFFGGFAGKAFPEEHRGLVNVFAAQDNYYLAQQLRQFAMLGIPASIKQAAKVTFARLEAAQQVQRTSEEMVNELRETIGKVATEGELAPPKYDEFVTDYLFPLPKTGGKRGRRNWNADQDLFENGPSGLPQRPQTLDFIVQDSNDGASFADRLQAYNESKGAGEKLGQNDMTTLLSMAKECFGDRQQLFLYILRADAIAYNSGRDLAKFRPLSTARAVALVWRDAYGELPDRIIYYQVLP